ncbi:hypothetical protein V9T40_010879 [Parthenolecanium corni]|uniref:Uncharacterized protein n=1 Tax=Parthenolecanium corni TaxID=536013 RepID=A0AAN9XYY1_9HEMI
MITKRHSKKLKCTRAERRLALRSPQVVVEATIHETNLAKMDENIFCIALRLTKITDEDILPKLSTLSLVFDKENAEEIVELPEGKGLII